MNRVRGFAVLDLETTGLSRERDRIVEVGVALFDSTGILERTFSTLLDPDRPMPAAAARVNGITTTMLRGQPRFAAVAGELASMLDDRVLVGHNIESFDRHFLSAEFRRAGVQWSCGDILDTLRVAKKVYPGRGSYKLVELCRQAEIVNDRAHRALDDVMATWRLLCVMATSDTEDAAGLKQYGIANFPAEVDRAAPIALQRPTSQVLRRPVNGGDVARPEQLPFGEPPSKQSPTIDHAIRVELAETQTAPRVVATPVNTEYVQSPHPTGPLPPAATGVPRVWKGHNWRIELDGDGYHITHRHITTTIKLDAAALLSVRRHWFRWVLFASDTPLVWLRGLATHEVALIPLASRLDAVVRWSTWYRELQQLALTSGRWISSETVALISDARPDDSVLSAIRDLPIDPELTPDIIEALKDLASDLEVRIADTNERIAVAEQLRMQEFFGLLESRPLSAEQQEAVVTFDNRVRLVAAAGSGKTSVLIARAAYAIKRGFIPPDRILMLAFNKNAADELRTRTNAAFRSVGLDATEVQVSTFHAFGLNVIGAATGEKPRTAPWLDTGQDIEKLQDIVADLRHRSPTFDYEWTIFRLVFGDTPDTPDSGHPDHYDRTTKQASYRTLDGNHVKSHGERMIADWLHLHGVRYEYEQRYPHKTATPTRSQYHPDFYYPDLDLWHEHWALDRNGRPPADWVDYNAGITWKRATHKKHGTQLLETSFGDVVYGDGLLKLENELVSRGVSLNWDPNRAPEARSIMTDSGLCKLLRTFMIHDKGSEFGAHGIGRKLGSTQAHLAGARTTRFLRIYEQVRAEWDRQLRDGGYVDFEEMLTQAAGFAASERYNSPLRLILVDEFQDMSSARLRLLQGVAKKPDTFLLAVGDDWQSINRFAGADVGIMSDFENHLGRSRTLALTTTFRCPQSICDVSSAFVQKSPTQIPKQVRSVHGPHSGQPIEIISTTDMRNTLSETLGRFATAAGTATSRVLVLGRYWSDKSFMPAVLPTNINVEFSTIHAAKGSEADFVVVVNMISGTRGFPSSVVDDPVLDLVLVSPETQPYAEERRLFYVALTRARTAVVVLAQTGRESIFLPEIGDSPLVHWHNMDGQPATPPQICPTCGEGLLRERTSKRGVFLGCSRFPACSGMATRRRATNSTVGRRFR